MKLLIISHTDHYRDINGNIVGWGPTVREIDAIAELFDEVVHIACLYKNKIAPASASHYTNSKVRFIGIEPFGGDGFKNKWNIITSAPANLSLIRKELKDANLFHFRAPTSIGLYIIPYLGLSNKKGWYKYAGNWASKNAPLSYRLQRAMLLKQSHKITINGHWDNQLHQCVSFENPSLYNEDRLGGKEVLVHKKYTPSFRLCFAGRLDKEKGVYAMLDAIKHHPNKQLFESLDIVGDGPEKARLESVAKDIGINIRFHGALNREQLFEIYTQSHFLLLPSESEGFPKVVAEASNFGCIPIVSDVSSIGQYINTGNGFLWNAEKLSFRDFFTSIDLSDAKVLEHKARQAHDMAGSFTYDNYISKLQSQILF